MTIRRSPHFFFCTYADSRASHIWSDSSNVLLELSYFMANQIKSKERVAEHGEVFTAEREVNAMLDLVRQETERIDSRFLEPACGTGNFLVEILRRKLRLVHSEVELVQAVGSIYGIDIMQDNVEECRQRLLDIVREHYKRPISDELLSVIKFVLSRNILWGDALTLCTPNRPNRPSRPTPFPSHSTSLGRGVDTMVYAPLPSWEGQGVGLLGQGEGLPIIFSEWGFIGETVKRRDYTLDMLLRNQPIEEPNLFSDLGDDAFIPTPCREYKPIHYLKLYTQDATQQ